MPNRIIFYSIKIRKTFLLWRFQTRTTVTSKFFYIFHALAIIYVGTNICNVILRWVNSQWNQSWIFRGSRRWVRRVFMKYWFFSYIPRRELGDIMADCTAGRFEYRRKMHNCLKFKCRWCCDRSNQPVPMYHVSSCRCVRYIILSNGLQTRVCVVAEFEMRWIIAVISQQFRTVETAFRNSRSILKFPRKLFVYKTILK